MKIKGNIRDKVIRTSILLMFFICVGWTTGFAQDIGGNEQPMQYSTHTYTVTMDDISYSYLWNIYDSGATEAGIIDGSDLPFSKGTDFRVVSEGKTIATSKAYITIRFDGNLPINTDYQLVYREESGQSCYAYRFFPFTLNGLFDVDVDFTYTSDEAPRCPDDTGTPYSTAPTTQTDTISYTVTLNNPTYLVDLGVGNWSFQYDISTLGVGGNDAIVDSLIIFVDGVAENHYSNSTSSYSNSKTVSTSYKEVIIKVFYIHGLGVSQNIDFELTNIEGSYQEVDADVVVPATDNNVTNIIYNSPVAGNLQALN